MGNSRDNDGKDATQNQTSTERVAPLQADPSPRFSQGITLCIISRDGAANVPLKPGASVIIGRNPKNPNGSCRIADRTLSAEHVRFTLEETGLVVEDLGSTNGTWSGGNRIKLANLQLGGEITLGDGVLVRVLSLLVGNSAPSNLVGAIDFRNVVQEEHERASYSRRPFAILAVRTRSASSATAPNGAWAVKLQNHLQPLERICLYTPDTALVLLRERDEQQIKEIADALVGTRDDPNEKRCVGAAIYPRNATNVEKLITLALKALEDTNASRRVAYAGHSADTSTATENGKGPIFGAKMRALWHRNQQAVHARNASILLLGETGTGKDVLANEFHKRSAGGPFKALNCGSIAQHLIASTLFGHERGAFTSADRTQKGYFEEACKGTLFLDEIAELPLEAQATLLRALDTREITPLGATTPVKVDVRIIAATHKDLEAMVQQGSFRQDLYYRLNTVVINIPPLRERRDEIEPLARRFLREACKSNGLPMRDLSDEALAVLLAHSWPGNIRQLQNAIIRAAVLCPGTLIEVDDLPADIRQAKPASKGPGSSALRVTQAQTEKQTILDALHKHNGVQIAAANDLGIALSTLQRRIKKYGIALPKKKR